MARLVFLTRGDKEWGMGHLHRVSWLAEVLPELVLPGLHLNVHCVDSGLAREFWASRGCPVNCFDISGLVDSSNPAEFLNLQAGDTLVVDWLESPVETIARLQAAGVRLVLLDDYGAAQHHATTVINALLAPLDRTLLKLSSALVFSGIAYVQLPPAITRLRGVASATTRAMSTEFVHPPPAPGPVHCILVSFGGNPRPQLIETALEALSLVRFTGRVIVMPAPVVPPAVPGGLDVEFIPAGPEFHDLLAAADVAILGGGLSLYEAVFLGVPTLAVAVLSSTPGQEHHQQHTIAKLAGAGCCLDAGAADSRDSRYIANALGDLLNDPQHRGRICAAGQSLIDGQGLARTIELILNAAGAD